MAKIDILSEQTSFLLEKQREVLSFFKKEIKELYDFLAAEKEQAEKMKAGSEFESFQNVISLLEKQEEESNKPMEQDIAFLEEQCAAIEQVCKLEDPAKKDELTTMMLEEGHEFEETAQFKKDVTEDVEEAKAGFKSMIESIREVFREDGVKELEVLLEAHIAAAQAEESEESEGCGAEDCCHGKDPECKTEGCSSEVVTEESCEDSCDKSSNGDCDGCNIFENLEKDSEDK